MVSWFRKKAFLRFGELLAWEKSAEKIVLRGQHGALELSAPAEHVARIRSGRGGTFPEDRSFAVIGDRKGRVEPAVSESPETVDVRFGGLRLLFAKKPLQLSVYDRDGFLLCRDHPDRGLGWSGQGLGLDLLAEPAAHYFGLGEKTGPLDKRGKNLLMWNSDMPYTTDYEPLYISIPFLLGLREGRAYGLFFDNPCRSRFNLAASHPEVLSYTVDRGELDLYVIAGPRVGDVVERYTALTGRMPMPPRWSLGHQQSRWSYMNEAKVRSIARSFRVRDIPTDVIYLDIHYMDRYRDFTFDAKRFPDPKQLTADLAAQGFRVVAAVDPGVAAAEEFPLYREGRDQGFFCRDERGGEYHARVWPGKVAFPDFGKPAVREWWGLAHQPLVDAGIRGVWNDMNEPSAWAVDVRLKEAVLPLKPVRNPKMVHDDEGRATPHLCFRNVYGLRENQAAREGLEKLRPAERPFILSRSGYAGIQRYAAVWTGDNSSTFSHLALTIPMLLNLGLSGVAFVGPDIGGFMWNCSPELYARWIQLAAFYPLCRTHTSLRTRRQEPWRFGERVTRIAREYLKLRYRLHPTLYSLVRLCHETGAPILRPLFSEFPDDRAARELEDELLFGPSLLLAPVVKKGQRRREVYLPAAAWTDYWTHEKIIGPKTIIRDAPLELMPIYVRDGAALFKWPALRWLDEKPVDRLTLDLYPLAQGSSEATLYEDDGISADYLEGGFAKRRVVQEKIAEGVRVRIEKKAGPFQPPERSLILRIHTGIKPATLTLDGKPLRLEDEGEAAEEEKSLAISKPPSAQYLIGERVVRLIIPDDFGSHEITVE